MRNRKWIKAFAMALCLTVAMGNLTYGAALDFSSPAQEDSQGEGGSLDKAGEEPDGQASISEGTDAEEWDEQTVESGESDGEIVQEFAKESIDEGGEPAGGEASQEEPASSEAEFQAQVPRMNEAVAEDYCTVQLSWESIENAEAYSVYRRESGSTEEWKWYAKALTNSYADKKAQTGASYEYTVRGLREGSAERIFTQYGNTVSAKTKLEIVDCTAESLNYCSVQVDWEKTAGATQYDVFRKTSSDSSWKWLKRVSGKTLTYVDKTAKTGVNYYYTVRAQRVANGRRVVGKYRTDLRVKAVLSAPGIGARLTDDGQIRATWGKVAGADGYHIKRKVGDGEFQWYANRTGLSLDDTKTEQAQSYTYSILAFRYVDGKKVWSDRRESTTVALPPSKPTLKVASRTEDSITLQWTKNKRADFYLLYRLENGKWTRIAKLEAGVSRYKDAALKKGRTYQYRIRTGVTIEGKNYYSPYGQSPESSL